jgi:hypothetical protein
VTVRADHGVINIGAGDAGARTPRALGATAAGLGCGGVARGEEGAGADHDHSESSRKDDVSNGPLHIGLLVP